MIRRRAEPASDIREGGAITREDTRVRECDLIMCRVASSTRRRAIGGLIPAFTSNRARRGARAIEPGQRTKSSRAGVAPYDSRRAWRVGLGSSSTCESFIRYVRLGKRQGCQRWRTFAAARREENARFEAGLHHRSAQRRREAPSAPVLLERTRKPSGSGCPFDSRDGQKSVVRIFGSSIRSVARHRGPPAGLVTGALT